MKAKRVIAAAFAVSAAALTVAATSPAVTQKTASASVPPGYEALGVIRSAFNPKYCLTADFSPVDGSIVYASPCVPGGRDALQVWSANRVLGVGYITLAARPHLVLGQMGLSSLAKTVDFTKTRQSYTSTIEFLEVYDDYELDLPYYHSRQLTVTSSTGSGSVRPLWSQATENNALQRRWIFPKWEEVSD
jgi:hypothetical protein